MRRLRSAEQSAVFLLSYCQEMPEVPCAKVKFKATG